MVCDETCVNGVIPRLDPQVNPIGCYDLKVGYDKTNDTFNGLASLNNLASDLTFSNPYNTFRFDSSSPPAPLAPQPRKFSGLAFVCSHSYYGTA